MEGLRALKVSSLGERTSAAMLCDPAQVVSPRKASERLHEPEVWEDRVECFSDVLCQKFQLPDECSISVSQLPVPDYPSCVSGRGGLLRELLGECKVMMSRLLCLALLNGHPCPVTLLRGRCLMNMGALCESSDGRVSGVTPATDPRY